MCVCVCTMYIVIKIELAQLNWPMTYQCLTFLSEEINQLNKSRQISIFTEDKIEFFVHLRPIFSYPLIKHGRRIRWH